MKPNGATRKLLLVCVYKQPTKKTPFKSLLPRHNVRSILRDVLRATVALCGNNGEKKTRCAIKWHGNGECAPHADRTIAYPELERTHKDHRDQLLATHRTTQKSDHISESITILKTEALESTKQRHSIATIRAGTYWWGIYFIAFESTVTTSTWALSYYIPKHRMALQ